MNLLTKLSELHDELARQFDDVRLRGQGRSSFVYVTSGGRGVEISEDNGGFWLEFWEKSDDEDAAPVKELSVESCDAASQQTRNWLG